MEGIEEIAKLTNMLPTLCRMASRCILETEEPHGGKTLCTVKHGHLEHGLNSLENFCIIKDLANSIIFWREIRDYHLWLSRMLWKIHCFTELNVPESKGLTPLSAKTLFQRFWIRMFPKEYTFSLLLKDELKFTWGIPITNVAIIREILDYKLLEKWVRANTDEIPVRPVVYVMALYRY